MSAVTALQGGKLALFPMAELLPRLLKRKLAIADADGKTFGEGRCRVLAVGGDEFSECREQTCLRQAIAVDAFEPRLSPGFLQIAESYALLLVIAPVARDDRMPGRIDCHVSSP